MTNTPATPAIPAGWYPDYTGASRLRWWDGAAWTEHVHEQAPTAGSPSPYSLAPAAAAVPAGTPVYNPFIWIIALLPILSLISLFTINARALTPNAQNPFAIYSDPGYLVSIGIGWLVYFVNVILAFFDWRKLRSDGYDRPFHWAWTFLTGAVYMIGRSVIVRRRSGGGLPVLWVWIAVSVIVVVVSIAHAISQLSTTLSTFPINA